MVHKKSVLALLVCLMAAAPASAIIIRHDRSAADYRVRESEFPAVFFLEQLGRRKVCVATLIDPRWAITAAHCLEQTSLAARLASGELFPVQVAGVMRHIEATVVHPKYPRPEEGADVDLALLRFSEPLPYPRPVSLYRESDELDTVVTLLGWGFSGIGTSGRQFDDGNFRRAQNRITAVDHQLVFRFDDPREPATAALSLEGMPGLGDSGGPALWLNCDEPRLMGVAVGEWMGENFDEDTQGSYGALAVYERISLHLDWIDRVTRR